MAASLTLDVVTDLDALPADQWRALIDGSPGATIFQELGWLRAWWGTCAPTGATPWVLTAKAGTALVGVAPLFKKETGWGRDARRGELRFIGDPHSDYNQFLVADRALDLYSVLAETLDSEVRRSGRATLSDMPSTAGTTRALMGLARSLGRIAVSGSLARPRIDLRGHAGSGTALLHKASFRRHAAKLKAAGTVLIQHLQDASRIREHLPCFFDQHVRRWSGTPFPSLFGGDHNRRLYDRLLDALPGKVLFTVVEVDGRPAAYHYGLLSGPDLLWYKPSFEIELADFSPGQTLLYSLVEWCLANDRSGLDFTRGDESFKARYANEVRENCSLQFYASPMHRIESEVRALTRRAVGKVARLAGFYRREAAS